MEPRFSEAQVRTSVDRLTAICAGLPECEMAGEEHLKIAVAGKTMGWFMVDHHGDGRISIALRAPKGENEALVASDPETFFLPQYVAHHGYVGIHLDRPQVDWDEVREFVTEAYFLVAPKRLSKLIS